MSTKSTHIGCSLIFQSVSTKNITRITGTDTAFVVTATINATTTSTVYTCGILTASSSNPRTIASAESTSLNVTTPLSQSIDQTSTALEANMKRQAQASSITSTPTCFASYTTQYPGAGAISTPCRNCFAVPFPSPAIITIPIATVTSTLTVRRCFKIKNEYY